MPYRNLRRPERICDRLLHSRNPAERKSIFSGQNSYTGHPVLLDTDLLFDHMHILGPSGSGKSTLGLLNLALQLIHRNDGAVVIFDGKGDSAAFHALRHAALRAGRIFKWFTNVPYWSTYVFNPWDRRLLRRLTLTDILGLYIQSLNLHHGEDYGRAWFSVNARILLRRAILETIPGAAHRPVLSPMGKRQLLPPGGPIQSFRDLHDVLREVSRDSDEFKAAQHLTFIVESLTDFDQLNLAPNRQPDHPAVAHAIYMPEVIREKQVIYFYLVGAMDMASVSELNRLGLYSLLTAVIDHYRAFGVRPRVYSIWDEAQTMVAKNIGHILEQARSHGLACILAHQSLSQLNLAGGPDLRELVMMCTAIKQVFGVRDPWLLKYISSMSGTTKYFRQKYNVSPAQAMTGIVGPQCACADRDGLCRIGIEEYTGPRLTYNDILDASRQPNVSLMSIDRASALSLFKGWFPVYTSWPLSLSQYNLYRDEHWPPKTEATIKTEGQWPGDEDRTVTAQPVSSIEHEQQVEQKLLAVWQQIEQP